MRVNVGQTDPSIKLTEKTQKILETLQQNDCEAVQRVLCSTLTTRSHEVWNLFGPSYLHIKSSKLPCNMRTSQQLLMTALAISDALSDWNVDRAMLLGFTLALSQSTQSSTSPSSEYYKNSGMICRELYELFRQKSKATPSEFRAVLLALYLPYAQPGNAVLNYLGPPERTGNCTEWSIVTGMIHHKVVDEYSFFGVVMYGNTDINEIAKYGAVFIVTVLVGLADNNFQKLEVDLRRPSFVEVDFYENLHASDVCDTFYNDLQQLNPISVSSSRHTAGYGNGQLYDTNTQFMSRVFDRTYYENCHPDYRGGLFLPVSFTYNVLVKNKPLFVNGCDKSALKRFATKYAPLVVSKFGGGLRKNINRVLMMLSILLFTIVIIAVVTIVTSRVSADSIAGFMPRIV